MGLLWRNVGVMCRNIKILRAPYAVGVTDDDVHAAALQYVRTVGGIRLPSPHNAEAFNQAVDVISVATRALLDGLEAGQQHAEANPGNPAASPEHLDTSPGNLDTSPEHLDASPDLLGASPEHLGAGPDPLATNPESHATGPEEAGGLAD